MVTSRRRRPAGPGDRAAPIVAPALGVVAFAVGLWGMHLALTDRDVADEIYRTLQLFVLDGGALQGITEVNPVLQVARFLAPIATVTAVLLGLRTVFATAWRRRRLARASGHTVICGNTPEARAMARNLRHRRRWTVVLVTPDPTTAPEGVPVVVGDPLEPETLIAAGLPRARAVYALARDDAQNIAIAVAAGNVRRRAGGRLAGFAAVRTSDVADLLRVRVLAAEQPPGPTLDFFSPLVVAGRLLLQRHPPGPGPVVVGAGEVYDAVLRALRRGAATPEAVPVGDPAFDAAALADRLGPGRRVYVCLNGDQATFTAGLRLATVPPPAGEPDRPRPLLTMCVRRRATFDRLLDDDRTGLFGGGGITLFGVDEACTPSAIEYGSLGGILERVGRRIHEKYVTEARAHGETVATNPSTVRWDDLPPHLRRSNVAQAENIGAALRDVAILLVDGPPPASPFAFTTQERDTLARTEHDRWVREREAAGFTYGPERTDRTHPDLVPWAELGPEARAKDYSAVDQLPDLLAAEGLHPERATGSQ